MNGFHTGQWMVDEFPTVSDFLLSNAIMKGEMMGGNAAFFCCCCRCIQHDQDCYPNLFRALCCPMFDQYPLWISEGSFLSVFFKPPGYWVDLFYHITIGKYLPLHVWPCPHECSTKTWGKAKSPNMVHLSFLQKKSSTVIINRNSQPQWTMAIIVQYSLSYILQPVLTIAFAIVFTTPYPSIHNDFNTHHNIHHNIHHSIYHSIHLSIHHSVH